MYEVFNHLGGVVMCSESEIRTAKFVMDMPEGHVYAVLRDGRDVTEDILMLIYEGVVM